ncbi:hypothetical protein [Mycobacteroides abscessus]|uniref:hypothetical protein n=1 Tax=Mycobacteroides abscessus TaxID=36809 RepID=UPI001F32938F|nr:hypothetical protein [Mycobacteroides abscessus]
MTWIIAKEPATLLDTWGEVMFVAGIDCGSAQFLIAGGAEYVDEHQSELPNFDNCATSFGSRLPGSSGSVRDASGRT